MAATITVTNPNDSGPGSLWEAITTASSGDTIDFSLIYPATITLGTVLSINTSLTINGPGALLLAISGNNNNSGETLQIASGTTVAISGVTIRYGGISNSGTLTLTNSTVSGSSISGIQNAPQGTLTLTDSLVSGNFNEYEGGGIENLGTMTITNSTISDNRSPYGAGAGIGNRGTLTLTNSTVSGNGDTDVGGGIFNAGTLTITNSTISGNTANLWGGGISSSGTLTLTNTTVYGNYAMGLALEGGYLGGGGGIYGAAILKNTILAFNGAGFFPLQGNCNGSQLSYGHNLSNDNSCSFSGPGDLNNTPAGLDPNGLQNNGGPTQTIALLPTSPAVDAIHVSSVSYCNAIDGVTPITTDQRGVPRPQGLACDIGAYELMQPIPPTTITTTSTGLAYSRVTQTFNGTITLTNISNAAISGPLEVVLTGLPAGVTQVNATGTFAGNPYITVPLPGGSLSLGQSARVAVQFKNPSNVTIQAAPLVYSGSFN